MRNPARGDPEQHKKWARQLRDHASTNLRSYENHVVERAGLCLMWNQRYQASGTERHAKLLKSAQNKVEEAIKRAADLEKDLNGDSGSDEEVPKDKKTARQATKTTKGKVDDIEG